jgi:ribosomal protein L24
MEIVTANVAGKAREMTYHGRKYLVAPMTLIVPGVLNGSQGPLYYPLEEVRKDPHAWNHIPIVVYHPMRNGKPVSARRPEILEKSGVGHLFNTHANGKLTAEGWFDVERTRAVDQRVLTALETNTPMELSTGLTLEQEPAPQGAVYNSPGGPRPYVAVARNYKPDHLAVLPDQKGACSVLDGCGVLVNRESPLARRSSYFDGLVLLTNARSNCGTGAGGFKKGNTCAVGGRSPTPPSADHQVGDIVKITGGEHKGKEGIVQGRFVPGQLLVRVGGKYNKSIEDEHIKATGRQDKETVDMERAFKEQQAREKADDAQSAAERMDTAEREARVVGGKVEGTSYTKKELFDQAIKAGKGMFGKALDVGPLNRVVVADLKDLKKPDSGHGMVEDYEYVFKPSTGKGLDVAGREWSPSWADQDGHIYSAYEDTVFVIKTPRAKRTRNEASVWDLIANQIDEVNNAKKNQPRVPAGSSKGGQFAPKAGDVVKVTGGQHAGREATVQTHYAKFKKTLIQVKGLGSEGNYSIDTKHLAPTGQQDVKIAKQEAQIAEGLKKYKGTFGGRSGGAPEEGQAWGGTGGNTKVAGTEYTGRQLAEVALKAGKGLFGKELAFDPVTKVKSAKLSALQRKGDEGGYVDEYEYVFHPSTGKGKDVSSAPWKEAKADWADKDGKIYTVLGDTIHVITPDVPLKGGRTRNEASVWDLIANRLVTPPAFRGLPLLTNAR